MSRTTEAPAAVRKLRRINRRLTVTEFDPEKAVFTRPDGRYPRHAFWVDCSQVRENREYFGNTPQYYDIATGDNHYSINGYHLTLTEPRYARSTNITNESNAFGLALRQQAKKDGFLQMAGNMDCFISRSFYTGFFDGPDVFERFENDNRGLDNPTESLQPNEIRLLLAQNEKSIAAALIPLPALNYLPPPEEYPNAPLTFVAGSGVDPLGWIRYSIE